MVISGVYIYENTNSKSSLAVMLRGQPTFYDQRLVRYKFWEILGLLSPNVAQNMNLDYQVNPENRSPKDSNTAAVLQFAITGQSPSFLDWSHQLKNNCNKTFLII